MATNTITTCDRCGSKDAQEAVLYKFKSYDLCKSCDKSLKSWLSRDNATNPGDKVGWEPVCNHYVPCGGFCDIGGYRRV